MMRNKKHLFLIIGVLAAAIFLKWQISTSGQFLTEEGLGSIDLSGLISQSKIILGGFSEGISSSPGKRIVANGAPGFSIVHDTGSTQKVCQLSGEYDNQDVTSENQRNTIYTKNQTWTNWEIWGVDGGIPVEHKGILYFLFGDITEAWEGCPGAPAARDCIAYTSDTKPIPTDGISLTFLPPDDIDKFNGDKFHPFTILQFPYIFGPIKTDGMEGPVEGLSYNGNMYVYSTTGWNEVGDDGYFSYSVLAKSTDDGRTFFYLYDLSNPTIGGGTCKFTTQVMAKVVENSTDKNGVNTLLPLSQDDKNKPVLFIWGAGNPFRKSNVYLAYQLLEDIDYISLPPLFPNRYYYKGLGPDSKPMWSPNESEAQPLFEQTAYYYDKDGNKIGEGPGIGEFSVAWNDFLNKWIMLYNFGNPSRGINFRVADYPWGPWSKNVVLFNPGEDKDKGYCYFMHRKWEWEREQNPPLEHCDYVYDGVKIDTETGQETKCNVNGEQVNRKDVWGGEYGPFIINRYTTGVQDQKTTIYFTLSTWNPYQKVLMKTTLTVKDTSPPTITGPYYSSGCSYNPVNGAYFCNDVVIWWLHSDNSGPEGIDTDSVQVGYKDPNDNYTNLTPGATITQSDGKVTFPASSLADGDYTIRISVSDVAGNPPKTVEATAHIQRTDTCKPKFLYDGLYCYTSCAVSPYAPVNNLTFSENADVSMFWWHSDNSGGVCCFDSGINTATASVGYKPGKPDEGGTYTYLVPTVNTSGGSFVFPIKTSNLADGDYTIKVSVCDKKSPVPNCTEVTASVHVKKSTPPTMPPTNLKVDSVTSSSLTWSWNAVSGATSYDYVVYTGGTCSSTRSSGSTSNTTLTVTGLSSSTTYSLKVRACSNTDCSDWSSCVPGTTSGAIPPIPPTNLRVTDYTSSSITWSWDTVPGATSYYYGVYNGGTCSTFIRHDMGSDTYHTETGLSSGTTYSFRVSAVNSAGSSDWSICSSGTTTLPATDFTIVVLPDTQVYSATYPSIFTDQTQWIVDNKDILNIKFVVHLGDIVNAGDSIPQQWTNADASMDKLDNVVPYLVVPGNHDYDDQCGTRGATSYNSKFGPSRFQGYSWYGENYGAGNENNYGFFSGNSQEFLVIGLEFCPSDAVLSWAESLINNNPNKKVILFTHSYMYSDNTRVDSGDQNDCTEYTCGASGNNGEDIWNELVSNHSNIILVLSGHIVTGSTGRRTDTVNNQPIHQILQNYQTVGEGGDGWLRYYIFRPQENKIEAVTYSHHLNQYLTDSSNQFDLTYPIPTPTNLKVDSVTPSSITWSWNAVSGATAYDYVVYIGGTCSSAKSSGSTSNTTLTVTGLNNSATYSFKVSACISPYGCSIPTACVAGTTPSGIPPTPTNLRVTNTTPSSLTWSWNAASGATSYTYVVYTGGTCSSVKSSGSTSNTTLTVTGLSSRTTYSFKISACTSPYGCSSPTGCVPGTTK